jgi:hypothetical protein
MRITQGHAEKLAAEIQRRTGTRPIQDICKPGDGRTHYVMSESMTSTYYGARVAVAYLLGMLSGLDPEGPVHWVDVRPDWIRVIDSEYQYGQIGRAALAAHTAGTEYGKTHRPYAG